VLCIGILPACITYINKPRSCHTSYLGMELGNNPNPSYKMSIENKSSSPFILLFPLFFKFVTYKKNYQTMPVLDKFPPHFTQRTVQYNFPYLSIRFVIDQNRYFLNCDIVFFYLPRKWQYLKSIVV